VRARSSSKPDSLLAHDRWVPRVAQNLADNVHEAFRGAIGAAEASSRFLNGFFLNGFFVLDSALRPSGPPALRSTLLPAPPKSDTITIWQHEVRIRSSLDLDATFGVRAHECEPTFHRCRPCSSCKIDNIDVFKNATSLCRA
jgi:hypothetical protein